MSKTARVVIGIVVILLVILGVDTISDKDGKGGIKIGFIGPLSGDAASIGEAARAAVTFAVEEINAAGGVDGKMIEVVYEDGKCNGQVASSAANKLINADKVLAIIGGACSAESSAFTKLAENAQVPVLSYCSSSPALTAAGGDYFFRNYPSDAYGGVFTAGYVKNTLKKNTAAVLYTQDDWGVGLEDSFSTEFERLGGKIVASESFQKTDRDLRTQIAKIKSAKPEAVYFVGFSEASIPGIKQLKEAGLTAIPIVGADGWGDLTIWKEVKTAGEGMRYVVPKTPSNTDFEKKITEKGSTIAACTYQAYDAAKVLARVIEGKGTKGEDIKKGLYEVQDFQGISGAIGFDENGDLKGAEYTVYVVRGGIASPEK